MKLSKFLKDILFTSFAQVLVLLFQILFVKIMAMILDTNSLGLLMVIRRWLGVLQPILTLNLALSLIKFVSADKEKQAHFFKISLGIINLIFLIVIFITIFFNKTFSLLLFNSSQYPLLTIIFVFFTYSSCIFLQIYSYFRGEQDMTRANILSLIYYGFPIPLAALLLVLHLNNDLQELNLFHFLYTFPVILAAFIYFWKNDLFGFLYPLKFKLKEMSGFLSYGLNRLPSVLFTALVLGFPVFWANYMSSLEIAGYLGIGVYIIRMMEIFSTPFNKIFLPKFSEFSVRAKPDEVKNKSMIVVDFVITFLPTVVISIFGLSKHILFLWLGSKFTAALPAVQISLLFSGFYLVHAITRNILNGVFIFPYVNIITLLGLAGVALPVIVTLGGNLWGISISFGIGLMILGVSSLYILVKKLELKFPWGPLFVYSALSAVIFLIGFFTDKFLTNLLSLNIYIEFLVLCSYRLLLLMAVFFLFWKKTLWYRELIKRINIQDKEII